MKHLKIIFLVAIALISSNMLYAQSSKSKSKKSMTKSIHYQCPMKCEGDKTYHAKGVCPVCNMQLQKLDKKEHVVAYQCPMKCEGDKVYNKAGDCPVCKMKLKAMAKDTSAATYQCPMKCEGDKMYAKAGKCPVCKMDLTKTEKKKDKPGHEGHNHN